MIHLHAYISSTSLYPLTKSCGLFRPLSRKPMTSSLGIPRLLRNHESFLPVHGIVTPLHMAVVLLLRMHCQILLFVHVFGLKTSFLFVEDVVNEPVGCPRRSWMLCNHPGLESGGLRRLLGCLGCVGHVFSL